MKGNRSEMNVTVYGMPLERYNGLSDGSTQAQFGELTESELTAGWHYCDNFDGLLIHPESEREYSCCRCNDSITMAFAKSARLATRTQEMKDIDSTRGELHRLFRTRLQELTAVVDELDRLEDLRVELARYIADDGA